MAKRGSGHADRQQVLSAGAREQLEVDGWLAIEGVLRAGDATALAERCTEVLATVGDRFRVGDKPAAGTRRLVDLDTRLPEVSGVVTHPEVVAAVTVMLGEGLQRGGATFRCPQPGFGEQRFHADDVPLAPGQDWRVATVIVALCDFTAENGATAVVPGSHRRPDLQRKAGALERHPDERVLTGPAGTAFVFNGHLLHRGTRNGSRSPRPALQVTWQRG